MSHVPPPKESPRPIDDMPDTPSGVYRVFSKEMAGFKSGRTNQVIAGGVSALALLISLGGVIGGYSKFMGDAKAQTKEQVDAGLELHDKRISMLEESTKQDRTANAAFQVRQEDATYRTGIELRELQKVFLTGRPSDVLNVPPPKPPKHLDGGTR